MPKYRFELQSQRGKPIEDPVLVYILETEKSGLVRNGRNLKPDDKSFTVDVMPGKYQLSLEVSDFKNFFTNELVLPKTDADPQTITVQLEHTCKVRPPDLRDRFVGSSGGVFLCAAAGYVRLSEMSGHWDCGK